MKKSLSEILVLLTILSLFACNKKQADETFIPPDLFAAKNYMTRSDLQGTVLKWNPKDKSAEPFLETIRDPIAYDDYSGINELVTGDKKIISIDPFRYETDESNDSGYTQLPRFLSEKLVYKRFSDDNTVLFDKTNGILLILEEVSGGTRINFCIQFKDKIPYDSLDIICGSDKQAVFTLESHYLYILNLATLQVESYADTGDWKVMAGDFNEEKLFLFEYNKTENRLREVEYFSGKTVADHSLAGTPIKGEILCVVSDEPLNTYVLSQDGEQNRIYSFRIEDFDYFEERSVDDKGEPLQRIDEIFVKYDAGLEGPVGHIVYLDRKNPFPVQIFYCGGPYWEEAK